MKSFLGKVIDICIVSSFLFVSFFSFPIIQVSAKTVGDVKRDLDKLERDAKANSEKLKYTKAQISKAKTDIVQINIDTDNISNEIIAKNKEIEDLNVKIKDKDAETKKLMEFIQLSNGESFYMEYVMGAETMTDFIYRISVTEQLSEYNSKLITEMNDMIKANEQRKIDLNNKTIELERKQVELAANLKILANEKIKLDEFERSIEAEIAVARDNIQEYLRAGCKDSDDINSCIDIPSDSGFVRPFNAGYVTSEYSRSRRNPITGSYEPHAAIDISSYNKSEKVYPVANGKVFAAFWDDQGGGNTLVIHHKIKVGGTYKFFTSTYCHLASIKVSAGSFVYRTTQVAVMGNTGRYTTGAHTHLAISNGRRYIDYTLYRDYVAHSFNPRDVISFPYGTYNPWYSR